MYSHLIFLVLGGILFPSDDTLQPPGHGIQQVLQVHTHQVSIALVCTVFVTSSFIELAPFCDFPVCVACLCADADDFSSF